MQFTNSTFKSTFARFRETLKEKNLELNLNSAQDVWGEIVLGKKFSAASASLNRHGYLQAREISDERICHHLKARSRQVDLATASALFTASVCHDLRELSITMHKIVGVLGQIEEACVAPVHGSSTGLGILRTGLPGCVALNGIHSEEHYTGEFAWLKNNAEMAADIINTAAGIGFEKFRDIFTSSSRETDDEADRAFSKYFGERVDESARAVAAALAGVFVAGEEENWDLDFDEIRDEIVAVFDELGRGEKWVATDCSVAEAMIDHLTARVRETLKWWRGLDKVESSGASVRDALDHDVGLSMHKFFMSPGRF